MCASTAWNAPKGTSFAEIVSSLLTSAVSDRTWAIVSLREIVGGSVVVVSSTRGEVVTVWLVVLEQALMLKTISASATGTANDLGIITATMTLANEEEFPR